MKYTDAELEAAEYLINTVDETNRSVARHLTATENHAAIAIRAAYLTILASGRVKGPIDIATLRLMVYTFNDIMAETTVLDWDPGEAISVMDEGLRALLVTKDDLLQTMREMAGAMDDDYYPEWEFDADANEVITRLANARATFDKITLSSFEINNLLQYIEQLSARQKAS